MNVHTQVNKNNKYKRALRARAHTNTEEGGKVHGPCKTDQLLFMDIIVPFSNVHLNIHILLTEKATQLHFSTYMKEIRF